MTTEEIKELNDTELKNLVKAIMKLYDTLPEELVETYVEITQEIVLRYISEK